MVCDYDENKGFQILTEQSLGGEDYNNGDYTLLNNTRGIVIGDYIYVVEPGYSVKSYDTKNYKLVDEAE